MVRAVGFFLLASAMAAQAQPGDPFNELTQAYWKARRSGTCEEAAALRGKARSALAGISPADPHFVGSVQLVAQFYQSGGRVSEARAVVEESLARTAGGDQTAAARVMLLMQMGELWEQDRNLLKAVGYREQAVALLDALPPETSSVNATSRIVNRGAVFGAVRVARQPFYSTTGYAAMSGLSAIPNAQYAYQSLAQAYRQLGRPEKAAEVNARIAARLKDNPQALASWYQQENRPQDAAALYRKLAEQPGDVDARANALQALAGIYQNQQRWADAAAAMRTAAGLIESSGDPQAADRTIWMRQNLAQILTQAGDTQGADRVWAQLLAQTQERENGIALQVFNGYASHLATTQRGAQAEKLLKDYLASHADLSMQEQANVLSQLANLAQMSGQGERAAEYRRAAEEKRGADRPAGADTGEALAMRTLQEAQTAANAGQAEEAYRLVLDALAAPAGGMPVEQAVLQVSGIATRLTYSKTPERGEQLFGRLMELAAGCSVDSLQPLSNLRRDYARFLLDKERWAEADEAIQAFREVLIEGGGKQSGALAEPLRMTLDEARRRGEPQTAIARGQDLLALEESLSGNTSEPYLEALQTMAEVLSTNGDPDGALSLYRQQIAIADLVYPAADIRRAFARTRAAGALAGQRQFDEAERLLVEAIGIGDRVQPSNVDAIRSQLEGIRRMKQSAPGSKGASPWFTRQ